MCKQCTDALDKYWPDLDEKERYALLIGATAFPVSDGEVTARQVEEMAERSGCDLGKALRLADEDLAKAMEEFHKSEAGQETTT